MVLCICLIILEGEFSMNNKRKIILLLIVLVCGFLVLNPVTLAKGKDGLAQIVQQHSTKIAELEKAIKNLSGSDSQDEALSEDVKKALLQEVEYRIELVSELWNGQEFNLVEIKIVEEDGQPTMQFFTEGNYDWTSKPNTTDNWGVGRIFASTVVGTTEPLAKLYGVDLEYEFYENGKRITMFTELE